MLIVEGGRGLEDVSNSSSCSHRVLSQAANAKNFLKLEYKHSRPFAMADER